MTTARAAVKMSHPPLGVLRLINPVLTRVLASPLGRRIDGMILLAFTGRRTGRHYAHRYTGLRAQGRWRTALGHRPAVAAELRRPDAGPGGAQGGRKAGSAHLLDLSRAEVGTILRRILDAESPRNLGIKVERGHTATADVLAGLNQSIIRLDLASD